MRERQQVNRERKEQLKEEGRKQKKKALGIVQASLHAISPEKIAGVSQNQMLMRV